jgi:hypothetical protein
MAGFEISETVSGMVFDAASSLDDLTVLYRKKDTAEASFVDLDRLEEEVNDDVHHGKGGNGAMEKWKILGGVESRYEVLIDGEVDVAGEEFLEVGTGRCGGRCVLEEPYIFLSHQRPLYPYVP